jgi:hypothetical protein
VANRDDYIKELRQLYQFRKDMAVFAGAGSSAPLGIPVWDKVLEQLGDKAGYSPSDIKGFISQQGYSETASIIYNKLDNDRIYHEYLQELFTPNQASLTYLHALLTKRFDTILTTNFDGAFTTSYEKNGRKCSEQCLPFFNPFLIFRGTPQVIHLHGSLTQKKYLFRSEEYKSYYPSIDKNDGSHELESFLRNIFSFVSLIFIGFSFEDRYLVAFLRDTLKIIEQEKQIHKIRYGVEHPYVHPQHYAIIPDDAEKIRKVEELGIKVIPFGNAGQHFPKPNYTEIELIIEEITRTDEVLDSADASAAI